MEFNPKDLAAEFERKNVSWRAQTVTKDGDKALALAYIDARDVMNRFDEVVSPANWSDSYTVATGGRVICTISIKINGEWVAKSDGAGDTKVEAEKGAISDAFKRAAVKWGVGRYLYDIPNIWVPCKSYKASNGKMAFSEFTVDPWTLVRTPPKTHPQKVDEKRIKAEQFKVDYIGQMENCSTLGEFYKLKGDKAKEKLCESLREKHPDLWEVVHAEGQRIHAVLKTESEARKSNEPPPVGELVPLPNIRGAEYINV